MPQPATIPLIRPISDLRTNLNDVCDQAAETQEPIYMTKNGKACLIVFDSEAYDRHLQHERAVQKLREAEIEARYTGETISHDDVRTRIERLIAEAETMHA